MKAKSEKYVWLAFEKAYELFESGNLAKAKRAYEYAARLGSIPALVNLANYYDDGTFGARDRSRAILLYKRQLREVRLKGPMG